MKIKRIISGIMAAAVMTVPALNSVSVTLGNQLTAIAAGSTLEDATPIKIGAKVSGTTYGNSKDFYKVNLEKSGRLSWDLTKYFSQGRFYIYNEDGLEVFSTGMSYTNNAGISTYSDIIDLTKGIYYIVICSSNSSNYGDYSFKLGFEAADETFVETGNGINNTLARASEINTDVTYKGQIAYNDDQDVYKLNISKDSNIYWDLSGNSIKFKFTIYNSVGEEMNSEIYNWNENIELLSVEDSIALTAGTYYFAVSKSDYTGNYSLKLSTTARSSGSVIIDTISDASLGDINSDGAIDALDASLLLSYYAYAATGGTETLLAYLGR